MGEKKQSLTKVFWGVAL